MVSEELSISGQNSISARALQKVVTAIAAEELRVPPKDVNVRLNDALGLLAVAVAAPLRLARLASSAGQLGIIQRTQAARTAIQSRTADITGSQVGTVAIRVTKASILEESRVS